MSNGAYPFGEVQPRNNTVLMHLSLIRVQPGLRRTPAERIYLPILACVYLGRTLALPQPSIAWADGHLFDRPPGLPI